MSVQAALFEPAPSVAVRVLFCCLNGSTADAEQDDPSLRRMMGFAHRLGADVRGARDAAISACGRYRYSLRRGSMTVVNLYGFRSTDPAELDALEDDAQRIGPENDAAIDEAARSADIIIAGWGASLPRGGEARARAVLARLERFRPVQCFGHTKTPPRQPRHPLYLPGTAALLPIGGPS